MSSATLDTLTLVETPEGIALRLRCAGLFPRAAAWAVDFAIRVGVVWACGIGLALLGATGIGLYLLLLFVVFWGYPILFEVLRDGQTLGKRALGLRVVAASGAPVSWIASIVRNLMRTVDMLPICYGFGACAALADPRSRRLGDLVAGTLVVHAETHRRGAAPPALPVAAVQPPLPLAPGERAAIVAFAERAPLLTPERQQELAALLPELTHASGALAVDRLLGMAGAILGRRA
jgi:uncharacterized RDD family membrane protein YckC